MTRKLLLAVLPLVVACRPKFDVGPLKAGDSTRATETIEFINNPGDHPPPPPPIDTLSQLTMGGLQGADFSDLILRARYNLDEKGTRGWLDFPPDNQPPGVRVDSSARIIIHGKKIGGAGTIQITGVAGTVDINLERVSGSGSAIAGRCKSENDRKGACATIRFKDVTWTPKGGQSSPQPGTLEVGVPRPGGR